MAKKELIFKKTETGCIIPISHTLNQDGYFRKHINGKGVMYHRHRWARKYGEIPEGFEIDHKCKNRACCNTRHLQMLSNHEHTVKDNRGRYEHKREEARAILEESPYMASTDIGKLIGVSFSAVTKWRRDNII